MRNGATLTAQHPDAGEVDLLLSVAGYSFSELASDAVDFLVAGTRVRVGKLEKLLESKRVSGRPKDLEFLRAFEARVTEDDAL